MATVVAHVPYAIAVSSVAISLCLHLCSDVDVNTHNHACWWVRGSRYPPVGFVIAMLTIQDPDENPQGFAMTLTNNPNGAFAVAPVDGDVLS